MAFGDEDLTELREQLIGAGHDPRGARGELRSGLAGPGERPSRAREPEPAAQRRREREREEFLAILGHELRNPLAPMQHAVELLQANAGAHEPDYLRTARSVLARQVEHLSRLVDVVLDGGHRPLTTGNEATAAVALIRRVAELHGGRVTVHGGAPGCDTDLRVWLPAAPPEELPIGASSVSATLRSRQILVVDDNEDAAEMLALVLRKRGYRVVLAFDGEEALVMAERHRPEIVLLDIGLPGIDGYEVARRLRARASSERPMLVAVTGYGQPADRLRSREAGFDHHLVKPVAMDKLLPLLEPRSD